jgi:hypothetical protein
MVDSDPRAERLGSYFGRKTMVQRSETDAQAVVNTDAAEDQVLDQQADGVETQDEQEDLDYKALLDAERTKTKKLEQDFKALNVGTMRQRDRDRVMSEISDRIGAIEQSNGALIRGLSSGEVESLPEELEGIQNQQAVVREQQDFDSAGQEIWESIQEAMLDPEGKPLLDINTIPELQELRDSWDAAVSGKNYREMTRVNRVFQRIGRLAERKKLQDNLAQAKRQARKEALDDADVHDMSTGNSSAGQSMTDSHWYYNQYATGKSDDHQRAAKISRGLGLKK